MDAALERRVRQRAGGRCEHCRLPQAASGVPFEIDHVIARKHRGRTTASNLAVSRIDCNGHKGPNLSGLDPATGELTPLFHPRRHKWGHHFRYEGGTLIGRTAIGRTTVEALRINLPSLVALRSADGRWNVLSGRAAGVPDWPSRPIVGPPSRVRSRTPCHPPGRGRQTPRPRSVRG